MVKVTCCFFFKYTTWWAWANACSHLTTISVKIQNVSFTPTGPLCPFAISPIPMPLALGNNSFNFSVSSFAFSRMPCDMSGVYFYFKVILCSLKGGVSFLSHPLPHPLNLGWPCNLLWSTRVRCRWLCAIWDEMSKGPISSVLSFWNSESTMLCRSVEEEPDGKKDPAPSAILAIWAEASDLKPR